MRYAGAFLTQFYLFPGAGSSIVTLTALSIYSITSYIFRNHHLNGLLPALLPVVLLAALHSNYLYTLACTLGLIVSLGYFAIYISMSNNKLRYSLGIPGWPLLYFLTGGYALVAMLLCFIHELFFIRNRYRLLIASLFPLLAMRVPYIGSNYIFYIKKEIAWTYFLPLFIEGPARYILFSLLVYCPLVLVISKGWMTYSKTESITMPWNWKMIAAGALLISSLAGWLIKRCNRTNCDGKCFRCSDTTIYCWCNRNRCS